ncbi:DHHW family protein [Limosilactobacillus equigenerosi]|uniref:AlgX/AlgJ SGNH hydrolase-like domain-containing protein n=1 Tax=Limosilactobacillus equigenerosi DSM 18793 = JCM 14505 TaxID=1423742 RepID=A0A0R1UFK9_9LACO|nr:DHHW family protein [Limosilactobacillus equigenerosi]KRL92230.1 hypothetical protein FC21_GL000380 [Limosilactobacillus equigenerosi DSM 18793 = JCM 14505]
MSNHHGFAKLKTILFSTLFIAMAIIALIMPWRPTKSAIEKRTLAKFPTLTVTNLINGKNLDQITTWYADTFPGREELMSLNATLKQAYGLHQTQVVGQVNQTAAPQHAAKINRAAKLHGVDEKMNNLFITGDRAYSMYGFVPGVLTDYAHAITDFAKQVGPEVHVYDVIVPTSSGIYLDAATTKELGGSDQQQAINFAYRKMGKQVATVNAFKAIDNHSKEDLYFRTDHHWTAKGAYYAYQALMAKMKQPVSPLSDYRVRKFPGFLGTSYAYSNQSPALKKHPDTVVAYQPKATNELTYRDRDGQTQSAKIIADATQYDEANKYMTFIAGDQPFEEINNPKLHDGSSIVVVKESFGNAFTPFLVNNFEHVYVVDYRYYDGKLADLVREKHIQNVVFLNNISAASTDTLVGSLIDLLK